MKAAVFSFLLILVIASCEEGRTLEATPVGGFTIMVNYDQVLSTFYASGRWSAVDGTLLINAIFEIDTSPRTYAECNIGLLHAALGKMQIFGRGDFSSVVGFATTQGSAHQSYHSAYARLPLTGEVILTEFDLENKLVSGIFKATVSTADRSETIIITHGSFTQIPIIE
jgi:hypothetical protein